MDCSGPGPRRRARRSIPGPIARRPAVFRHRGSAEFPAALTIATEPVELAARLWHEAAMARRNHLAGFFWGAMSGLPVHGAIVGTLVGVVLAVGIWLYDRRRA